MSSVIGAVALSSSVLIRRRQSGATSYLPPLWRVHATAGDARRKEHSGRRMERGMENVQRGLKTVESRDGEDVLQLVIASGY